METAEMLCRIVVALTALFGSCFSICTWRRNIKFERNRRKKEFFRETLENKELLETFRLIDYGKLDYDKTGFHNNGKAENDLENRVDRLLIRFSYLVDSHEEIILDDKVFNFLNYELQRTLQNEVIHRYLFNLMNFSQNIGTKFPYQLLVEYGKKHGFLDATFFNAELGVKKYGKTLNW